MSRIGRMPIPVPDGVEVELHGQRVTARGKRGQLQWTVVPELQVELEGRTLRVLNPQPSQRTNSLWGTTRTVLRNMLTGLSQGYTKTLEIVGTGYRAELKGDALVLEVGFDHPITYAVPADVKVEVTARPMRISVSGIDIERVGQVAAEIRGLKKPEPYHGKGIRYMKEVVRQKAGKTGA